MPIHYQSLFRRCAGLRWWMLSWMMLTMTVNAQNQDSKRTLRKDIVYANLGDRSLKLDLYQPGTRTELPLIVWIHGGAWRAGNKSNMPLSALVHQGFSVASVEYRLSPEAPFPANVHDIKAAIRFLRANAVTLGLHAEQIIIAGASAGGHLASLVGVTNGHPALEGNVGEHGKTSSDVLAIVSFYGASNLTSILDQSTPHGLSVRVPALQLLLGAQPKDAPELARLASPVFHVDSNDPPLLMIHGDQDQQMPINQSHELEGAYQRQNRVVQFKVLHGEGHGGKAFYNDQQMETVRSFLNQHLNLNLQK